jgi:hypothetical protein
MRAIHSTIAILFALTATSACDSDQLVTPEGARFDALASSSCQNVRGTGTVVLDLSTGQLVGALSGDLTGTHRGSGTGVIPHGDGATSQTAVAIYETNEVGTFVLAEDLVIAPVSPSLFKVTLRATVVPGDDVTSGFLTAEGHLDVSGLPQGAFDYRGRICTAS